MNNPKMPLHISFFGPVMADWQRRQTHFENVTVKKSSRSVGKC